MSQLSGTQHQAEQTIRTALQPFGYDSSCIRFRWKIPNSESLRQYASQNNDNPNNSPSGTAKFLDALAFADSKQQNWNTSAIAFDLGQDSVVGTAKSQDQARNLFELTAAPTNVVGSLSRRKVDLWFNCHDGIVGAKMVDFSPDALTAVFQEHRSAVQRDMLAHLRTGQHHLFDRYLYARRDELVEFLQRGISKATWFVSDLSWGKDNKQTDLNRESFSRIALALLAARILEDKGALGEKRPQATDARQLLAEAQAEWDSFFDIVLDDDLARLDAWFQPGQTNLMLQCLLSHLTGPVNFSLVTHEMLGDLYERALVAERSIGSTNYVKLKGVHYTPLAITRRILDRIPLEDLPPSHRTICDFACGSGSFLLAATERLANLYDPHELDATQNRTEWLRQMVMGNDIDPVAIMVARLSYLIAYWNRVDEGRDVPFPQLHEKGDALTLDLQKTFGRMPNVIVGNPPFDRAGQPASQFLDKALTVLQTQVRAFPGYIGMVMPGAFLKGKREQASVRNKLVDQAHILEVWELPEHTIGLWAETPTCVIIAEVNSKKPPVNHNLRVCQTISRQMEAVRAIRDVGVTSWSFAGTLVINKPVDEDHSFYSLAFSPIDDLWSRLLERGPILSTFAEAVWGFVHTKSQDQPEPEFSPEPAQDFVPYIRQQKALRPYFVTEEDWRNSHKNQYRYWRRGTGYAPCPGNWVAYESPKIVISAQSNRNAFSQLVAALDFSSYYPGKHFLAVTLSHNWRSQFRKVYSLPTKKIEIQDVLRWLCGILNSLIGHAWFAKHAAPRGPKADVCLTMPLPKIYDPAIAASVRRLENVIRPQNLGTIPTWDPSTGIVPVASDLYDMAETDKHANDYWHAVSALNDLIWASYGLGEAERMRFRNFMMGMVKPWVEYSPEAAKLGNATILRVLRGKMISLDPLTQSMKVELSWKSLGNGSPVSIPIPKFMPGWALESGREFTCRAPAKCSLNDLQNNPWLLRDFEAISYSYLSIEDLETMIGYQKETVTS